MVATSDQMHAVAVCSANPGIHITYGFVQWPNTTASRYLHLGKNPEKEIPVFNGHVIIDTGSEVVTAARKFCFAR